MNILGVSAHYHDSAACLIRDGEVVAAAQEEAFSRKKHDARFPVEALRFCLEDSGLTWSDLDWIGYYELPERKLQRILATNTAARGGDAGGALGIASYIYHHHLGHPRVARRDDGMRGAYLGPSFSDADVRRYLDTIDATYQTLSEEDLVQRTAALLAEGSVVGWFQGRMEFGPRALGNRSILADPRDRDMQRRLNLKIKKRESFRPFAPAVLAEDAGALFELPHASPYMLFTAPVAKALRLLPGPDDAALGGVDRLRAIRSSIPAVTHVDYSARVQTVHQHTNPLFHRLLTAFKERTGCPALVNTSFNVRGEPMVCSPNDAFKCFMRTEMDYLVMGHHLLERAAQRDPIVELDQSFEAD